CMQALELPPFTF
nr:immunoglobulin light chain junction region [Macaca mulatta]MOX99243.1 immunoglobulin light chain junction region [Macaca mulatta]MOY02015.1 immunoglobulin light chain junction region [Macaca mulatta]